MYDLNINSSFDFSTYNFSEYEEICITLNLDCKSCYSSYGIDAPLEVIKKAEITIESSDISYFFIKKLPAYDLISLKVDNNDTIKAAIGWKPDIITFNFDMMNVRKGYIRGAVNAGIFIEIPMVRTGKDRKSWLRNVQRILDCTKGKNVIFTSGAKNVYELKQERDLINFLFLFNVKERKANLIIKENPKKLLIAAARKRFSYRNTVANTLPEGRLKSKYILEEHMDLL